MLTGTGTAGAYHAGVLRAFHEAGVKVDIVAGKGVGVIGAMFAAIDGISRLWDEKGLWRAPEIKAAYPWRPSLLMMVGAILLSLAIVILPITAVALGLVVYPIDFLLKMLGASGAGGLTAWYVSAVDRAFAPEGLPTWLPRIVLLVMGAAAVAVAASAYGQWRERRPRGGFFWHCFPEPLSAEPLVERCWSALWDQVRGATQLKQPGRADLGRRYTEMLADNLGQPGFRELLIVAHDLDANRDVVFALVSEPMRRHLIRRGTAENDGRAAEVVDLAGVGRDHMADAVAAALTVPLATSYYPMTFAPDSYWRGETHRFADRLGGLERVVDELVGLGVEQVVLVSSAPWGTGPHALAAPRIDGRGKWGEYLQSAEAAMIRDVVARARREGPKIFVVRPTHNAVGPFDFGNSYDDRSVRALDLSELVNQGYSDAYHQFVEPVVGASGERVGQ